VSRSLIIGGASTSKRLKPKATVSRRESEGIESSSSSQIGPRHSRRLVASGVVYRLMPSSPWSAGLVLYLNARRLAR